MPWIAPCLCVLSFVLWRIVNGCVVPCSLHTVLCVRRWVLFCFIQGNEHMLHLIKRKQGGGGIHSEYSLSFSLVVER